MVDDDEAQLRFGDYQNQCPEIQNGLRVLKHKEEQACQTGARPSPKTKLQQSGLVDDFKEDNQNSAMGRANATSTHNSIMNKNSKTPNWKIDNGNSHLVLPNISQHISQQSNTS